MVVEQSIHLVTESTEQLHRLFSEHPVFVTNVSFTEEAVAFSPTDDEILHEYNSRIVEQTIQLTKNLPRILEDKNFVMLFAQPMPRGPDPSGIILSTRALNSARRSCDMIVKKSFQKAAQYSEVFEEVRMVQHFKSTWDEKEYKAVKRDIQAFRQDMLLLKQWSDDVESMKTGEPVGALYVDSSSMQADLQSSLAKALDVLKQLLANAARKQCVQVQKLPPLVMWPLPGQRQSPLPGSLSCQRFRCPGLGAVFEAGEEAWGQADQAGGVCVLLCHACRGAPSGLISVPLAPALDLLTRRCPRRLASLTFTPARAQLRESKDENAQKHQVVLDMYDMLSQYGGKIPPNDQLNLDDLKEVVAAFGKVAQGRAVAPSRLRSRVDLVSAPPRSHCCCFRRIVCEPGTG